MTKQLMRLKAIMAIYSENH